MGKVSFIDIQNSIMTGVTLGGYLLPISSVASAGEIRSAGLDPAREEMPLMNAKVASRCLRALFSISLAWFCGSYCFAAHTRASQSRPGITQGSPVVQDVQPPNWWSHMPNPMVLLYGKNLTGAQVTSSVAGISVRETKISDNGHWVFVWLDIQSAPPQRFALIVRTARGRTRVPYELDKRHPTTDGFQGFTSADVMYLIMPDRFSDGDTSNDRLAKAPGTFDRSNPLAYHGGDLLGIENHLDYIQKLGVTTLWVTPLYSQDPLSMDYDGYEPFDMYRVNPHFGTLKTYEGLATAVHSHGMKLVLDIVANQVSPKSPWVSDPPAPDWFHGTQADHLAATDDFGSITDPHAAPAASSPVVDGWFRNVLPDLNQSNPLVAQYLIQNAIWWIESGTLDGLRLDTFPYVDRSFWHKFHAELHALYPNLTTVGEVYSGDPTVVSYFDGGAKRAGIDTGVDTLFDFPSYFALRSILAGTFPAGGASMTMLKNVDRLDWLYPHASQLVTFLGNQDTGRFLAEAGASPARLRLAFGLLATMRGMPQIYAGDEVAMPGSNADNRQDFPGGFPGDTNDAFTVAGRTPQQEAMYVWVQGLLALRAHHAALQTGTQQDLMADKTGFVFARMGAQESDKASDDTANSEKTGTPGAQGGIVLVLMNKSSASRRFHLDFSRTALDGANGLTPLWNTSEQVAVNQNQCDINVPAEQLIVFAVQR